MNRTGRILLLALALTSVAAPAAAEEPRLAYHSFTLGNGLRVYVLEDHSAPTAYVVSWFRVGSKDERPGKTGFAHLFEHLMFKGSKHLPDGLLDRLLEGAGGYSNAFTSGDMTVYYNAAASNFLETMFWIDADRLAGLMDTIDQAKLDNQRDVVRNERRQSYETQPYGMAEILTLEALWPPGFGYHWSTIGYHEDLVNANLGDVGAFFKTFYVPNNVTMVVAGDVDPKQVRALVDKYFGWIPRGAEPNRPVYKTPPPITKEIQKTARDRVQVPRVYLTWRGPVAFSKEEPALTLAASILGDGKNSRLYKRLVFDERIAQDVSAFFNGESLGGMFQIVATAKPGVAPEKLTRAISEELARLGTRPPTQEELERAKNGFEAAFLNGLEALLQRAIKLAAYDMLAGDPNYLAKDLARHRAVTQADVQGVVSRFLVPNARVVLTILPEEKTKENK